MTFREKVAQARARQKKALKKAAICAALVGIAAISIGLTSRPAADTHLVEITYTVKPGDTWWGIVEHFRDVDEDDRYIFDYEYDIHLRLRVRHGAAKPGRRPLQSDAGADPAHPVP